MCRGGRRLRTLTPRCRATIDLGALGLTHFGNLSVADQGTGSNGCQHDRVALYFNHTTPMVLGRFPNIDPETGTWNFSLADRTGSDGFGVSPADPSAARLLRWVSEPNPWLHGYWYYSWSDAVRHESIGLETKRVSCA